MANNSFISDKQRYESHLFFNTKYLIRDVFTYSQIKELVLFAQDILEDKEDGNYYTDPKVTHPNIKIDVSIPKDWTSSSYKNDVCPSFTHKGLQIFVCDDKTKKLEELHTKYTVMLEDDYGCGYDSLLDTDDWNEVLEFVNKHGDKHD